MNYINLHTFGIMLVGLLTLSGCATHIKTSVTKNPPPAEIFGSFSRIEMRPISMKPPYEGNAGYEKVRAKIQANVNIKMDSLLAAWNAAGPGDRQKRALLIEPAIAEIKFVSGNKRFWAGPLSGSSAIVLTVKISELDTGKMIASPTFYSKANAWGGAFTIGAMDNLMLVRIAGRLTEYLEANYTSAVGGPSGAGE